MYYNDNANDNDSDYDNDYDNNNIYNENMYQPGET